MVAPHSSLRSVFLVSICSLGQLLVQFMLQLALARYFGASVEMDAYVAAITLPTVLSAVLVGSLSYAFVPVYLDRREREGATAANQTCTTLTLLVVGSAMVVSTTGFLQAGFLVSVLYPGFSAEQIARTAGLLRILIWLTLTNSLISFLQALHHSEKRFVLPAIASILGTGLTVGAVVAYHGSLGITAVAWGVLAGAALCVLLQLPLLLSRLTLRFELDEGTARCLRLLLPLILGAAYSRLEPLVDRYLASELQPGSLSHLGYAWRLVTALLTVGTSGLSVVAFPALVTHAVAGKPEAMRAEIAYAYRFLTVICVPLVIGSLFFSDEVIADLFQRGEFTAADTAAVALLVVLYLGMVIGGSAGEIAAKVFYSIGDTRTPVLIGVAGFTLGIVLKLVLVPQYGAAGLVVATSVYYIGNVTCMMLLIGSRIGWQAFSGTGGTLLRSGLAVAGAVVTGYLVIRLPMLYSSLPAAFAGFGVYLLVLWLLGDEFAGKLSRFVVRRRVTNETTTSR